MIACFLPAVGKCRWLSSNQIRIALESFEIRLTQK